MALGRPGGAAHLRPMAQGSPLLIPACPIASLMAVTRWLHCATCNPRPAPIRSPPPLPPPPPADPRKAETLEWKRSEPGPASRLAHVCREPLHAAFFRSRQALAAPLPAANRRRHLCPRFCAQSWRKRGLRCTAGTRGRTSATTRAWSSPTSRWPSLVGAGRGAGTGADVSAVAPRL